MLKLTRSKATQLEILRFLDLVSPWPVTPISLLHHFQEQSPNTNKSDIAQALSKLIVRHQLDAGIIQDRPIWIKANMRGKALYDSYAKLLCPGGQHEAHTQRS